MNREIILNADGHPPKQATFFEDGTVRMGDEFFPSLIRFMEVLNVRRPRYLPQTEVPE